jgi:hypothetical protein
VIAIHDALSVAVHEQPTGAETATLPVPPFRPNESLSGAIELHGAGPRLVHNVPSNTRQP